MISLLMKISWKTINLHCKGIIYCSTNICHLFKMQQFCLFIFLGPLFWPEKPITGTIFRELPIILHQDILNNHLKCCRLNRKQINLMDKTSPYLLRVMAGCILWLTHIKFTGWNSLVIYQSKQKTSTK